MREPGDDREDEDDDDGQLVPLGLLEERTDALRLEIANEAARDLLQRNRQPPHDMSCERSVIGGMLLEPSTVELALAEGLKAGHFHRPAHGVIFATILNLHAHKRPIDTLTVVDALLAAGKLDDVGGAAAISSLEALLPTAQHVGAYAKIVVEKAQLRALIDAATRQAAMAFAQNKSAAQIVHSGRQALDEIERGVTTTRGLTGDALEAAIMAGLRKKGETPSYVPVGIPVVDNTVGGIPRGGIMVIAAERKTGKTTVVGHIALHCVENGFKVGVWSFEMSEAEVGAVVAGQHAGIHVEQNKELTDEQLHRMAVSSAAIKECLHVNAPPGLTAEELAAQFYAYKHRHDLDLIIVENLQGIQHSTRFEQMESNHRHVADVMRRVIKDLKVAAIFMSQIKTQSEDAKKSGRTPKDDSVPQTNAWGDNVYLMATMSRPKHDQNPRARCTTQFQIVANRINGKSPIGHLFYDERTGRLDPDADPVPFGDQREPQRTTRRRTFGERDRFIPGVSHVPEEPAWLKER